METQVKGGRPDEGGRKGGEEKTGRTVEGRDRDDQMKEEEG